MLINICTTPGAAAASCGRWRFREELDSHVGDFTTTENLNSGKRLKLDDLLNLWIKTCVFVKLSALIIHHRDARPRRLLHFSCESVVFYFTAVTFVCFWSFYQYFSVFLSHSVYSCLVFEGSPAVSMFDLLCADELKLVHFIRSINFTWTILCVIPILMQVIFVLLQNYSLWQSMSVRLLLSLDTEPSMFISGCLNNIKTPEVSKMLNIVEGNRKSLETFKVLHDLSFV